MTNTIHQNAKEKGTHTPGPWRTVCKYYLGDTHPHGIFASNDLPGNAKHPACADTEANANLIAAAPDLFVSTANLISVVEQLIPEPSARGIADVVLAQARAALLKAEGGAK